MTQGDEARDEPRSWDDPATVERFAQRDADHRLLALLEVTARPGATRVLDLGCAGGRNTEVLAHAGFDVWAIDRSPAMVKHTRMRVARWLGRVETVRRVRLLCMTHIAHLPVSDFDLIVALGIYHQAADEDEWDRALDASVAALARPALLLVSCFAPGTVLPGRPLSRVPGTAFVFEDPLGERMCLRTREGLDDDFLRRGLRLRGPSEVVVRETDGGRRVTVNALYARA